MILDGTWYNVDKTDKKSNYYTNRYLLSHGIQSKISSSKTHNKGVIVDDKALVSSINWNENSPRNNREIGVILTGSAVSYYERIFNKDFGDDSILFFVILTVSIFIFYLVIIRPWTTRQR